MQTNKVTRSDDLPDGWYKYRNITIKRDDSNKGYHGHWYAKINKISFTTDKRATLLKMIDEYLDNQTEI